MRGGGQRGRRAAAALRSPYPAMTAGWQAQQGQSMGKDVLGSSSSSTAGRQAQQGQSMGRTCLAAAAAARLQLCCAAHRDAVDDELHVGGLQHSVKTQVDVASLPFPRGRRMGEEERGVSRETRWGKRAPRARVGGPRGCAPPPPPLVPAAPAAALLPWCHSCRCASPRPARAPLRCGSQRRWSWSSTLRRR